MCCWGGTLLTGGIPTQGLPGGAWLALIYLAVTRRTAYKQQKQAQAENAQRVYDVDEEEFTSFYDQYRTESQE